MQVLNDRPVLVCVDDDPLILSALRRTLARSPLAVLTTSKPDEALRWVETRDVRLVLSDQRMPGMLGTHLLDEVRQRSPSTAVLLLTAYPGETASVPELPFRVDALLSKPWDNEMLQRVIEEALEERKAG